MENITDSELLKIAENWEKEQPINIGIKTAFAAGYRMAEIKAKNCTIPDVKASALEKLKIAKKALNDIYNFDRDMEFEYGDPGERAMRALESIDRIDGF